MSLHANEEVVPVGSEATSDEIKHYAHIVSPPENVGIFAFLKEKLNVADPSASDIVHFAREHGLEVVALCGYKWIPTKDPDNYDACQICMDVAGMHMRNAGE